MHNPNASTPIERLRAVRDYANTVFDDENLAATWLSRAHRAVRGGLSAAGAACQEPEGFSEALAELARMEQLSRAEALSEVTGRRKPRAP